MQMHLENIYGHFLYRLHFHLISANIFNLSDVSVYVLMHEIYGLNSTNIYKWLDTCISIYMAALCVFFPVRSFLCFVVVDFFFHYYLRITSYVLFMYRKMCLLLNIC